MSDIRILGFMRAFPAACVSLPPQGVANQYDPWTIGIYHGILKPGMNEWLTERDMKPVYNHGSYELRATYDPQKLHERVHKMIDVAFADEYTIKLFTEAGLRHGV